MAWVRVVRDASWLDREALVDEMKVLVFAWILSLPVLSWAVHKHVILKCTFFTAQCSSPLLYHNVYGPSILSETLPVASYERESQDVKKRDAGAQSTSNLFRITILTPTPTFLHSYSLLCNPCYFPRASMWQYSSRACGVHKQTMTSRF